MTDGMRMRLAIVLAVSALGAAPTFDAGVGIPVGALGDGRNATVEIAWDHPDLHAVWRPLGEVDGRVEVRVEIGLRPTAEHGSVWIGYPRYRVRGTWKDAIHRVDNRRERTIRLQRGHVEFGTFTVLVSSDARTLRLPLGRSTVEIDLSEAAVPRATEPTRSIEVTDSWRGIPVGPAPDRPARVTAGLAWTGTKPFDDGALDAGETGAVPVEIRNDGDRTVHGARIRVDTTPSPGVTIPDSIPVPAIGPGERRTVDVPIAADRSAVDAVRTVVLHVEEPYGHDAAPLGFDLVVRAAPVPRLTLLEDLVVDGAPVPVPRDRIATVRLRVRNVGEGPADDATASIRPAEGVFPADGSPETFRLGRLGPGEVVDLTYRCYANRRAESLTLEVELNAPASVRPTTVERVVLPLEDTPTTPRIVRVQPDPRAPVPLAPVPPALVSDVDRHLPRSSIRRPTGLAVVLGVESYATLPPASAAAADGRTAARYFEHALGIPAERIEVLLDEDVTLAQLQRLFGPGGWLERRIEEDSDLFVFFAGHGTAALDRFVPFLLPVDVDLDYVEQTGYSLDRLIDRVAALDAGSATIFLDVCFSGLTREGGALLPAARPLIAVAASRSRPGIAVFSASRGSQVANTLDTEGHGLFSYYLFRGLRGDADLDADAAVTAGELKVYLEREVPRAAMRLDREQAPSILLDRPDHVLAGDGEAVTASGLLAPASGPPRPRSLAPRTP